MRYSTQLLPAGDAIEIVCTHPGARDGCLMGYVLQYGGGFDAWVASVHDHTVLRKVATEPERVRAVERVVQNWNPGY